MTSEKANFSTQRQYSCIVFYEGTLCVLLSGYAKTNNETQVILTLSKSTGPETLWINRPSSLDSVITLQCQTLTDSVWLLNDFHYRSCPPHGSELWPLPPPPPHNIQPILSFPRPLHNRQTTTAKDDTPIANASVQHILSFITTGSGLLWRQVTDSEYWWKRPEQRHWPELHSLNGPFPR